MQRLCVLRKIARTRRYEFHFAVHFDARADGIAVRFHAAQPESDRSACCAAVVLEDADLRAQAALEHQVEVAVAIEIGDGEGAAVVGEIEAADAGEVIVFAAAAHIEDVGLAAGLAVLFMNGRLSAFQPFS